MKVSDDSYKWVMSVWAGFEIADRPGFQILNWKGEINEGCTAVSYTHLDVYKRQGQNCRTHCLKYCRGINCSSASFICSKYCIYAIRWTFYSGYEYPAQTSDIGEFPTGTAEGSTGSFCSKLFPGSRSHHFRTDHFLFTGSIFLFLPGLQRKKCAVYAGDGNYDDSGRGNDYFRCV